MDTRGEKLQRARILLRELSSLDASNIENIDTNKLQELAKEYAILSNDSAIKDQFRRMEQNVSIPPVVMQLLERAKDNPASVSSHVASISNSATAIHAQEMQIQELRAEYDSMSDYDKKNMSIEDFRKYYKVDSRVIIDNPHRFQEEARRNPSMFYETTYHNGREVKVFEVPRVAANDLKEETLNLKEEDEQCTREAEQIVRDTYVYLIRTGHTREEAMEKLKNQYGNHPFYQGFLNRIPPADFQSLTEHANQEGALSDEEAKREHRRLLANRNRNEEERRRIIERCGQINEVADNLSAGAQTVIETGQNLGDQVGINAGQEAKDTAAGIKRILSGIYNKAQDIIIPRDAVEAQLNRAPNATASNNIFSSFINKNFIFSPKISGHGNSENNVFDANFILDNVNMNSVKHVYDSFNDERMEALDQKRVQLFNMAITDVSLDFTGSSVPVEDLAQHVATLKASIVEIKNSPTLSANPEIMAKVQELDEQLDTAILESLPESKREEYSSRLQEALPQQTAYVRSEIDKERTQFNNALMLEIELILKRRKMESDNWKAETREIAGQNALQNALIDSENLLNDSIINQSISEINNEITNPHIDSFINDEVDIPDLSEGLVEDPQDFIGANMFEDPFAGSLDEETDLDNTTEFLNGIEEETVASDDTSIQEEEENDLSIDLDLTSDNSADQITGNEIGEDLAVEDPNASEIGEDLAVEDPNASEIGEELAVEDPNASEIGEELAVEDPNASEIGEELAVEDPNASENDGVADTDAFVQIDENQDTAQEEEQSEHMGLTATLANAGRSYTNQPAGNQVSVYTGRV